MKKFIILIIIGLFLSINLLSQTQERELIIKNETGIEYLGLYYLPFEPIKDPYISAGGDVYSDYKYKYFIVKNNENFEKIFTKYYNVKIYFVKDSIYYELFTFKLDCSIIYIELYETHYHIKYMNSRGEEKQYSFKKYE
jgi:hypothetical protein